MLLIKMTWRLALREMILMNSVSRRRWPPQLYAGHFNLRWQRPAVNSRQQAHRYLSTNSENRAQCLNYRPALLSYSIFRQRARLLFPAVA